VIIVSFYFFGRLGISGFYDHPPTRLIELLAMLFIAYEVLRSVYRLYASERAQREAGQAKKKPTTPLVELAKHIVGTGRIGGSVKAFACFSCNSGEGDVRIALYGGRKRANQSHLRLEPIPSQHWETAHID
jgi:hypothetical protein